MLEKKDIEQAKKIFKEWDNKNIWNTPSPAFLDHIKKKSKDTLQLAAYLLNKIEQTNELDDIETVTIWVITTSYYAMFFEVESLLGLDNKKLPKSTKDTHKTIYLAFIYYHVIKGSELEQQKSQRITTSRMSNALSIFKEIQDEALELQRIEQSVRNFQSQRIKRNEFTYQTNRSANISKARNSLNKAKEFRELIQEYILLRKMKGSFLS